jgi:hypothetical protein
MAAPGCPEEVDDETSSRRGHRAQRRSPPFARAADSCDALLNNSSAIDERSRGEFFCKVGAMDLPKNFVTGVIGDPRYASADLGAALWDACVTWLAITLESIATTPVQP